MDNLQTEVLEIEFLSYSNGMNTISEEDFAHILLRYTNVENTSVFLENVHYSIPEEKVSNPPLFILLTCYVVQKIFCRFVGSFALWINRDIWIYFILFSYVAILGALAKFLKLINILGRYPYFSEIF